MRSALLLTLVPSLFGQGPMQAPQTADERFDAQMHGQALKVEELKAQIDLLRDRIKRLGAEPLGGNLGSTQVTIAHAEEMGLFFTPRAVTYALDGAVIFTRDGDRPQS